MGTKGKKYLKIAGFIVGAFIILIIGSAIGASGAEITVKEKAMDITKLDEEIDYLKGERDFQSEKLEEIKKKKSEAVAVIEKKDDAQKELDSINVKLKDIKGTLDDELEDGRREIEDKLEKLNSDLSDKKSEVKEINSNIKDKKSELASVTGAIQKKKDAPKNLVAGQYEVGKDVPEGRYQATAIGRGTNFFVYDSFGSATVNTILGNSAVGRGDYIFFANEGDTIETRGQVKLIPIK
ncbi:coiled-coil domain-containing protein [Viridibacillus arvi]|uniref:coiled-coil domain-containing protein n=1 Tax=Viridibacillus arvi TaxID=263475 RepID=UPI0034CF9CCA